MPFGFMAYFYDVVKPAIGYNLFPSFQDPLIDGAQLNLNHCQLNVKVLLCVSLMWCEINRQ